MVTYKLLIKKQQEVQVGNFISFITLAAKEAEEVKAVIVLRLRQVIFKTLSTMATKRADTKVIVVGGGGTIGSSTALHLLRNGYTPANITVLDTYQIPSAQSAGHDLNKIMGVRLRNKVDIQMSLEAREMWNEDELFKPFFHNTGRLDCEHTEDGIKGLRAQYQTLLDAGVGLEKTTEWLDSEEEIVAKVPLLEREQINVGKNSSTGGEPRLQSIIQGWKAIWSQDGGWLAAAKAINAIGEVLKERGVNFGLGAAGSFKQPLFESDGTTCIGVETIDGTKYYADKVVLAAGAWSPTLVDLEDQCCSKAWVFAHIQLTPEEAAEYKGNPVVYNGEIGFFFEPNEFQEKELFNRAMCWCTDTADAALLICEHPKWKNFILATGDSGHSFKILPNVGKHVVELIEGSLPEDMAHAWRWRPGGDALKSRRAAPPKDLAGMPGWKHDPRL
ncbi:sarcosine oxidase [Seiridium cupressi]